MATSTVFITGGAGFIGSALVRQLLVDTDYHIVNIDKLTYAGHLSSLAGALGHERHTFVQADINQSDILADLFEQHQPCGLIHLAAESHVDNAISTPSSFIDTNILGTFSLLQTSLDYWQRLPEKKQQAFRFHHVSTDEVYGTLPEHGVPFSEHTPYSPQNPYSASKASSDHLVRAWHNTYGLPTLITHCSNNYGPRQLPEKLIPKLILHALHGKPLPLYGNGQQIRDWLYVDDHTAALWQVFTRAAPGSTYNIGGNNEQRNIDIARAVCTILNTLHPCANNPHTAHLPGYETLITHTTDRPGHDARYAVDATRIRSQLGWQPATAFDAGLHQTVAWYLAHPEWWLDLFPR